MMWQIFLKKPKKESNMLFKQPVQQKQKNILRDFFIVAGVFFLLTMISWFLYGNEALLLLFFPLLQINVCMHYLFQEMEWFEIYEDKIIVRNNALRIKNMVLFKNVKFVEEGKLNLLNNAPELVDYYILNDGRKNKRPGWPHKNEFRNRKKYNLRIYKTDELETFLKERFEIRQKDILYEE